jgi:3-hydroxyisobutyrate dehydrogenase-like beta-hydroxyacid dehydrogenase
MKDLRDLKVGFIGLGDQGAPIARAIAEAGFELHAWARKARSLDALDGVRYVAHQSPAELGAVSDIVGLCLNVDDNVREIMTTGGLLALMANQENLRDMLAIADGMRVEIPALVDVLRAGTSSSRALQLLGSAVTSENADHLREMQLVDMDIFADAVHDLGDTAADFTNRAVLGAKALPELAARIH